MKIGFLFPGQGAQTIGMGKDLYDEYEEVRVIYNKVYELTGIDIANITFNGEADVLNQTQYTQLAILTMSLAITEVLNKKGIKADVSCGLSLGEYTALIYSKILSFDEGVKLVQKRGEYMQTLVPEGNWKMAAILGLEDSKVQKICETITKGFAKPVNYNCPGQVVVSGDEEGINELENLAKEMGAKKVRILNTSGPFHTEKLIDSSNALRKEMENIKIHKSQTEVIKNIDGKPYTETDDIKEILVKHIISPVKFSDGLKQMLEIGVDTFIEIGPGKTLSGFIKRIPTDKKIKVLNINNVETLNKFITNE